MAEPTILPAPPPMKSALADLRERLAMIPPEKTLVLVATGELKNGIPSGKVGWASRVGDKLVIANEWELKLQQRPSTKVWVGFAFALLLALLPGEAAAQRYPASLVLSSHCSGQSAFNCPTAPQTIQDDMNAEASVFGPFHAQPSLTVEGQASAISPITALHRRRCPSNVPWFIPTVILNAIDGVDQRRARADISNERTERLAPFITHADTSSTITRKGGVTAVGASLDHSGPRLILTGPRLPVRDAILGDNASRRVWLGAAAGSRLASFKRSCGGLNNRAAVAPTQPILRPTGHATRPFGRLDDYQTAEPLADQINAPNRTSAQVVTPTLRIYPVQRISRVIDGDTYVLVISLGFDVSYTATIRLADLDTPELRTDEGKAARAAAERLLKSGPVTVVPTGKMTFARHVAHVYVAGASVAAVLAQAGFIKVKPP